MRDTDMRAHYDFSRGVRGTYHKRAMQGTNLILLDPDVAKVLSDADQVNAALRELIRVARTMKTRPVTRRRSRAIAG